jgi:YbbR domain-containing protein
MLKAITHNLRLKLLALGIALVMWIFVVGQDRVEMTVEVPVEITGIPADMVIADDVVNKVYARISGPGTLVRRAVTERTVQRLDLAGMGLGEHVFQIVPEDLRLPAGVSVLRVSPARFTITLASKVSRQVQVRPALKGSPAEGYEVGEIKLTPAKVTVSGTKKEVENVDWIWTVRIDVSGLKSNTSLRTGLRLPRGDSLQVDPITVEAEITIRPKKPSKPSTQEKSG